MGLYVSHDCWTGAYSAFTRWRNTLAEVAGYEVKDHRYPNGDIWPGPTKVAEGDMNGMWTAENFLGEWPNGAPEDPLLILLVHSDCDGYIEPNDAKFLAMRLEQIMALPTFPQGDESGHIRNWQTTTQAFIDGLRKAAANDERVEFE